MAVEGEESGGGKLIVGGDELSVSLWLASVVVVITFVSSSNFFTSNCVRLLILYIKYRRGQDTIKGFKFKLNKNNIN